MAKRLKAKVTVLFNNFDAIADKMPDVAMAVVQEALDDMHVMVDAGMRAGGGGRIYKRGSRTHRASAPGQMPAVDEGELVASMSKELDHNERKGYFYTELDRAPALEYGTSRMLARPFMTPAAQRARARFLREMRQLEVKLR